MGKIALNNKKKVDMKREDIKKYIEDTRTQLKEQYKEVKPDWEVTLTLMEDTLEMIVDLQEGIKERGLFDEKGRKNPLINSLKDYQTLMLRLSQKLGTSPYDISKIKKLSEDDDTEEFIESLIKDDE